MSEQTRVTLVIPTQLWEHVKRLAPERQRSRLVIEALQAEVQRRERLRQLESLHQFQETMIRKYGELPEAAADITRMRQERDDEISDLH
jgi:hypothetical protein